MGGKSFAIKGTFEANDKNWTRNSDKMARSTGRLESKLSKHTKTVKAFEERYSRSIAPMKSATRAVAGSAMALGAAATFALKDIIDEGAGFEKTMKMASTKFGESAAEGTAAFKQLEQAALDVGENTEFAAQESAGALKFMAMAGEKPLVALGVLADAADFATAAETDLAAATDMMSDSMGPMMGRVEGTEARLAAYRRTMDLMTHATTRGNMGLEEMFEATKMGAAAFRSGGQDIEQFTATVAVLSNAGIKGSKAGKDLARMMDALTAPSKEAAKAMKDIDFSPVDKDGTIRDFDDIMKEMRDKTAAMSEGDRSKFLATVIGKNSKASALAIMENVGAITTLAQEAKDATGITAGQAKDIRNTTEGMMKGMDSAIGALKLGAFQVIKEDVKDATKWATNLAKANKEAFSENVRKGINYIKNHMDELQAFASDLVDGMAWIVENFPTIIKWGLRLGKVVAIFWGMEKAIMAVRISMQAWEGAKMMFEFGKKVGGAVESLRSLQDNLPDGVKGLNNMDTAGGKAAGGMILVATAIAAWKVGTWIDQTFGLSDAIAQWGLELTGVADGMARIDKMENRKLTKTNKDRIDRTGDDLTAAREELSEVGWGDVLSGQREFLRGEVTRLEMEYERLQVQEMYRKAGIDRMDKVAVLAYSESQVAKGVLANAKRGGVGGEELEALQQDADAKAEFAATFIRPGLMELPASANGPHPAAGASQPEAPTAGPPPTADAPEDAATRDSKIDEAATAQVLQAQTLMKMLEELEKLNSGDKKTEVTVNVDKNGKPTDGGVDVPRTGTL